MHTCSPSPCTSFPPLCRSRTHPLRSRNGRRLHSPGSLGRGAVSASEGYSCRSCSRWCSVALCTQLLSRSALVCRHWIFHTFGRTVLSPIVQPLHCCRSTCRHPRKKHRIVRCLHTGLGLSRNMSGTVGHNLRPGGSPGYRRWGGRSPWRRGAVGCRWS